jgi:tRNA modification GTPase
VLYTKCDLAPAPVTVPERADAVLAVSALTGDGLDLLTDRLCELTGATGDGDGTFSARARHVVALCHACDRLAQAAAQLAARAGIELVAEELRLAQVALGELTGEVSSDDLLGEIFSAFCIGK